MTVTAVHRRFVSKLLEMVEPLRLDEPDWDGAADAAQDFVDAIGKAVGSDHQVKHGEHRLIPREALKEINRAHQLIGQDNLTGAVEIVLSIFDAAAPIEPEDMDNDKDTDPVLPQPDFAAMDKGALLAFANEHELEVNGRLGVEKLRVAVAEQWEVAKQEGGPALAFAVMDKGALLAFANEHELEVSAELEVDELREAVTDAWSQSQTT